MKWYEGCEYPYALVHAKEVQNRSWQLLPTKYIVFPSLKESFLEQDKLIAPNGAYEKARSANNHRQFIEAIKTVHASEPNYIESLLSLIETYSLNKFDSVE